MDIEEIPSWVPSVVRSLAVNVSRTHEEEILRFLTDIRMRSVWIQLVNREIASTAKDVFQSEQHTRMFGIVGPGEYTLSDHACASIFYTIWLWPFYKDRVITKSEMDEDARPYRTAVDSIQSIIDRMRNDNPRWTLQKLEVLIEARDYCEEWRSIIARDGDPYRLDRQGPSTKSDVIRGHIRALSILTYRIYGAQLRGTLTKIANVVFSPEQEIPPERVRGWLSDLTDGGR